ncbi:hypothetical protein PVK06_031266 [Gossypium arboreum]|uniref:Reverse transcriptase domain-containing protein n=1 Tax=Gossypium arboreum TaxID=29729 RepID=A0ABR0NTR5_GOSAR|nr:hypothetical protein PVK06_031266 [Gossypium arboreum]
MGKDIGTWQYRKYKELSKQIGNLKSMINKNINNPGGLYEGERLKAMRLQLGNLMDKEEKYWAQRLRITWVVYKIVAKVLANRLKDTLLKCISQNQSAFVPGRMIHDNILITHELVHYLQSATNNPNKGLVIKLDMSKEYDRVEWKFIVAVMRKMGYAEAWRFFLKAIIQSIPTYAFLVLLAPKGIIEEIHSKMGQIWWTSNDKTRGWAMMAWNHLCYPKGMGGLNNRLLEGRYERCIDWLEDALRKLDSKAVADFFTLLWNCWNNRNKLVFQGKEDPARVLKCKGWKKSPKDFVKINVDVAIFKGGIGYGVVIRDVDGFVLGGCYGFANKTLDIIWEDLEALSMG